MEYTGKKPWFRIRNGIKILHGEINRRRGETQRLELFGDFPSRKIKRRVSARVIFAELN